MANELGAGNPRTAQHAAFVSVLLTLLVSGAICISILLFRCNVLESTGCLTQRDMLQFVSMLRLAGSLQDAVSDPLLMQLTAVTAKLWDSSHDTWG